MREYWRGILEAHGVKVTFTNNEIPECINELKNECVEIQDNVDAKALNVCNATTITKEQAAILAIIFGVNCIYSVNAFQTNGFSFTNDTRWSLVYTNSSNVNKS